MQSAAVSVRDAAENSKAGAKPERYRRCDCGDRAQRTKVRHWATEKAAHASAKQKSEDLLCAAPRLRMTGEGRILLTEIGGCNTRCRPVFYGILGEEEAE